MPGHTHNEKCDALYQAIDLAFRWVSTEQGNDYWQDVYTRACKREFDQCDIDCTIPEKDEA
jgi:hypothetical protein